ncbi:MAG: response regulator [Spirochaetaceae bacterium]|nr:MAG: response regulator [Spirochaetaceae bacterium]
MGAIRSDPKYPNISENNTLRELRTHVLNRFTWVVLLLGGAAAIVASVEEARNGRYLFILMYGLAYLLAVSFSVVRRWPYTLRSWILLLVLFSVGVSELYFFGFASLAFLFFFMTITFSGILLGLWSGILTFVVCLVTTAVTAGLYALNLIPIESETQHVALTLTYWISPTTTFAFMAAMSMVFLSLLMRDLDKYIRASNEHLQRAEEEMREREKAEERLRQAQRMESVGRLAGGIAHDFNNLLTTILGYSELILEDSNLSKDSREGLGTIRKSAQSASALTKQLLAFSRKQVIRPQVLSLNTRLSDMEMMLRRLIGEAVELEVDLDSNLGWIEADPGQIEQVILNLAANGRDAMLLGGKLSVSTRHTVVETEVGDGENDLRPGEYAVLDVTDTGTGMDAQTIERIFDPFFTTKELGKGTGLGLATVYGIVKQHKGYIEVVSKPQMGSSFTLYFPCTDRKPERDVSQAAKESSLIGNETVLIVEDEEPLRRLLSMTLQKYQYGVIEADSGADALRICEQGDRTVDVLLTDVVMPAINGRELADSVKRLKPNIHILFISGYTDDIIARHDVFGSNIPLLQKPFTPEQLVRRIREVLDRGD